MKKGDKVILIIHGAGQVSEEEGHKISCIDDKKLELYGQNKVFYKEKDGIYRTKKSDDPFFGFLFEIKEIN